MPDRRVLASCLSSSLAALLLSVFVHSQWATPTLYSDIGAFWARGYVSQGLVPYSSQATFFEYPPVSGLILHISRTIGGSIAGAVGGEYAGYYLSFGALSLAAMAVMVWSIWRLGGRLDVSVNPLYFFLPSVIVYGIYNFDVFNALFIVLSLLLFVEKRRGWSAAFLGVALATKLVAGVLLPVFLLELAGWKERGRYVLISAIAAGVFFVPIAVVNPGFFSQFFSFYSGWGLEDAWYVWIFQNPFSQTAKEFGLVVMVLLLVRAYTLKVPLVQRSFLALCAYLLSTFIYAPQFNVTLIPLVAVLALTSPALYFLEVFNALIIFTWFTGPNPTHPWTVPQAMALLRSASLALLGLSVASDSGHSAYAWLVSRFRTQRRLQGFAIGRD